MKFKAMIGAFALTLGLATVSHAQQATAAKVSAPKAATTATTTKKKSHKRHHRSSASAKNTAAANKMSATMSKKDSTKR